jgi:hypothetical protein
MGADIYTPRTLGSVIRRTPDNPSFLKDLFFSASQTFHTETISFDVKKGKRTITPFVHPLAAAPLTERIGYKTITYTPAMKKEKRALRAADLETRLPGEQPYNSGMTNAERQVQMLAEDTKDLKDNLIRAEEAMAADLMFTGALHIKGDKINDVVDFGFTNKETLSGDQRWSQSTSDFLADLRRYTTTCRTKSGYTPNVLIANAATIDEMLKNTRFYDLLNNRRTEAGNIAPQQPATNGAAYIGHISYIGVELDIYSYDNEYIDPVSGDATAMVPANTICLASTNAAFIRLYGANTFIPEGSDTFQTFEGQYVTRTFTNHDPDAKYLEIMSRPLYVPVDVDSFYVATVL